MDVGCRPAIVGVASFRGEPPGVPGGHLLLFDFSFEVGDGGGRVAGEAFSFCSLFCEYICPFISFHIQVARDPVDVGCDSSREYNFGASVGFQDVFLSRKRTFVGHSAYCRLVVAEDPGVHVPLV